MTTPALDYATADVGDLISALDAGEVSAVELFDAARRRIEALNPRLNAVVALDLDRALIAAQAADLRRAAGERAPLLGIPMTVKDSHNMAGLPTTWGLDAFRDWRPRFDSVGVARLKSNGAIILGKTNVPPNLGDWQSANPVYGRTLNPHDPTRSPGGSSGGGAAAVAAGLVPLEFGSDIGGSIRVPAHFCGVFGLKPTFDLIPQTGHAPPGTPEPSDGAPLSVLGPIARSVRDLERALDVLAGPHGPAAAALQVALPPPRASHPRELRFAVLHRHPLAGVDQEVSTALEGVAAALSAAGARRLDAPISDRLRLERLHETYLGILMTITGRGQPDLRPIDAYQWMDLLSAKAAMSRTYQSLFDDIDVILAPPFGVPAFAHDDAPAHERRVTINGKAEPYLAQIAWSGLASLTGAPALAAPIALSTDNLPIGVQILGPLYEDRTPLGVGALLETLGLARPRPPAGLS